jgi:hypothetical protein
MTRSSARQAGSSSALVLARRSWRDQRVHRRALDAGVVARIFGVGGLAAEQVGKLLARVVRALEGQEVMSKSNFCRRCWYSAKSTGRKRSWMPSFSRLRIQGDTTRTPPSLLSMYSSTRPRPWRCAARHPHFPARLFQQLLRAAQVGAQDESPSVRGGTSWGQTRGRQLPRQGSSSASSSAPGTTRGLAVGVAKQAVARAGRRCRTSAGSSTRSPRQAQGLAHAHILQLVLAGVEHVALKARGQLVRKLALDQFAGVERLPFTRRAQSPARKNASGRTRPP